jgi:hypothetical protein
MPGIMTMEFHYVLHVIIVVTIVKDLVIIIVPNVLLQIIEPILLLQYLHLINAVVMKVIMMLIIKTNVEFVIRHVQHVMVL